MRHRVHDVVIVGAGPAGLASARELERVGIEARVLERGAAVGTSWRARHEELRLNTIRWLSELPGLAMPREYGRWVRRDDYVRYLEAYAEAHGVAIQHGVEVRRLDRDGAAWRIEASDGMRYARHVVVATGPDLVPWMPPWRGRAEFADELRHVAYARAPGEYAGRDVLVVGGGNSGVEWSEHLVGHGARTVWLSVRRPPNLLPREIAGVPLHPAAVALERLPIRLRDLAAGLVRRVAIGDLSARGLPIPAEGPYRTLSDRGVTVAIDTGFTRWVRAGRIRVVPRLDSFAAREVVLADGSRLAPEVVLTATGYRTGLEPLVGHLGVLRADTRPVAGDDGRSAQRGLWFIGFTTAIAGTLRRHGLEARRMARSIGGEPWSRRGSARRASPAGWTHAASNDDP